MTDQLKSGAFVESLLAGRRASALPWLVWHSASGERIELSGRVFDNWVAKSANLLGETYDLEPGDLVVLDYDAHWKSLVLALAVLHHGATLAGPHSPQAADAKLWITASPLDERIAPAAEILAVDPAALALSFGGQLGPVAEDYNSMVRSFADQFYPSSVPGDAVAIAGQTPIELAALFHTAAEPRGTILVRGTMPVLELLPYAAAQWAAGDALVLIGPGVADSERLRSGERITFDFQPEAQG